MQGSINAKPSDLQWHITDVALQGTGTGGTSQGSKKPENQSFSFPEACLACVSKRYVWRHAGGGWGRRRTCWSRIDLGEPPAARGPRDAAAWGLAPPLLPSWRVREPGALGERAVGRVSQRRGRRMADEPPLPTDAEPGADDLGDDGLLGWRAYISTQWAVNIIVRSCSSSGSGWQCARRSPPRAMLAVPRRSGSSCR